MLVLPDALGIKSSITVCFLPSVKLNGGEMQFCVLRQRTAAQNNTTRKQIQSGPQRCSDVYNLHIIVQAFYHRHSERVSRAAALGFNTFSQSPTLRPFFPLLLPTHYINQLLSDPNHAASLLQRTETCYAPSDQLPCFTFGYTYLY